MSPQPGQLSLVWYECSCTTRMRVWNGRHWPPPLSLPCPSCGGAMSQTDLHLRSKHYYYEPHRGQPVLVNIDRALAEKIVDRRCRGKEVDPETREFLINDLVKDGRQPWLTLHGFEEDFDTEEKRK